MDEEFTPEEMQLAEELAESGYGYPKEEEKQNIFSFFRRVIFMPDTSRTSNLTEDELGMVKIPVRTNLELAEYCKHQGLNGLSQFFFNEAQIISNTSLSRDGFLDKLAVTQKREVESKRREFTAKQKKNWFKKPSTSPQEGYS